MWDFIFELNYHVTSITAKRVPFEVTFLSDGMEFYGTAAGDAKEVTNAGTSAGTKGFQLYYIQS